MNSIDLHDYFEKRRKCVGVAIHNHHIYYAISGEDGKKANKHAKAIEMMIGTTNTVRCYICNTFTVLKYIYYKSLYYKNLEDYIYNCLYSSGKVSFAYPEYLGSPISFKSFMLDYKSWHPMGNYSCVERKIVGTIGKKSIEIIVGLRPCYLCLPAIKNVTYYDQIYGEVHSVFSSKRNNVFYFFKNF